MAKIKTGRLEGVALDWAVAKALGLTPMVRRNPYGYWVLPNIPGSYSTEWVHGGPIIDQMARDGGRMLLAASAEANQATFVQGAFVCTAYGPTALVAAMRCFVTARLGEEVEVPDNLLP